MTAMPSFGFLLSPMTAVLSPDFFVSVLRSESVVAHPAVGIDSHRTVVSKVSRPVGGRCNRAWIRYLPPCCPPVENTAANRFNSPGYPVLATSQATGCQYIRSHQVGGSKVSFPAGVHFGRGGIGYFAAVLSTCREYSNPPPTNPIRRVTCVSEHFRAAGCGCIRVAGSAVRKYRYPPGLIPIRAD